MKHVRLLQTSSALALLFIVGCANQSSEMGVTATIASRTLSLSVPNFVYSNTCSAFQIIGTALSSNQTAVLESQDIRLTSSVPALFYSDATACGLSSGSASDEFNVSIQTTGEPAIFYLKTSQSLTLKAEIVVDGEVKASDEKEVKININANALNWFNGTWSNTTWLNYITGDFSGDGKVDMAGRAGDEWYVGVSQNAATPMVTSRWGGWSVSVTWTDLQSAQLTNDSKADIVGRYGNQVYVASSTGTAFTNKRWAVMDATVDWTKLYTGDISGDGIADILAIGGGDLWVGVSDGVGTFTMSKWATSDVEKWATVYIGRLNNDAALDVVGIAANGDVHVALAQASSFTVSKWMTLTLPILSYQGMGDFGGDGLADLLITTQPSAGQIALKIYRSDGAMFHSQDFGTWEESKVQRGFFIADMNGDTRSDIVGFSSSNLWNVGITNAGATAFTEKAFSQYSATSTWEAIHVADFTGGGAADVLARTAGSWWLGESKLVP